MTQLQAAPTPVVHATASGPAPLTMEQFRLALPDKLKKSVNQDLVDHVNQVLTNPDEFENYRNNLLSYTKVLQNGRFKVEDYVNAVRYVSFKLMGCSNIEAYTKAFPDRYARHVAAGTSAKDIASYVSAYNKNELVNLIYGQSLVPSWVLNQDLYQKALNVQAELMMSAHSEKVRTDAANSLLTHLEMPETTKVELDLNVKEDSSIAALRAATQELARAQRLAMEAGAMSAQQVAHSKVSMAEVIDVESRQVS